MRTIGNKLVLAILFSPISTTVVETIVNNIVCCTTVIQS